MIDCFIDSIGLQLCAEAPTSGLYLSSLPGLSVEAIDNIADSEQVTYLGVYADVQTNALAQFNLDVRGAINGCHTINKDCDYDELICANAELLYLPWKYLLGVQVMQFRRYSPRLNWFTIVTLEDAKELEGVYQAKYEEALKAAINVLDVSSCELCCDGGSITYQWRLP